jgi:peptidoglycan/LPS O-acetylase OafA/YrhL
MSLRGVAVAGVFFGHLFGIGSISIGTIVSNGTFAYQFHNERFETWKSLLEIATPLYGKNFVILFFVLSGFLMAKVMESRRYAGAEGTLHFYRARFLRLAPALYFNLLICWALFAQADLSIKKTLGDIFFVNNFTDRGLNLVTWSLSHEMQFYLICPLVFLVAKRWYGMIAVLALAAYSFLGPFPYFAYLYTFFAGFFLYRIPPMPSVESMVVKYRWLLVLFGLCALHFLFDFEYFNHQYRSGDVIAAISSAFLIYVCSIEKTEPRRSSWVTRSTSFLGHITYGFYLWHYVIIRTRAGDFEQLAKSIAARFHLSFWQTVVIFHVGEIIALGAISIALGYLSYVLIETRFRPDLYSPAHLNQPHDAVTPQACSPDPPNPYPLHQP